MHGESKLTRNDIYYTNKYYDNKNILIKNVFIEYSIRYSCIPQFANLEFKEQSIF